MGFVLTMTGDWIPNTPFGAWPCAHLLEYTPFRRSPLTVADAEREIERLAGEEPIDEADIRQVSTAPMSTDHGQAAVVDGYWDDEIERQFHYEVKGG